MAALTRLVRDHVGDTVFPAIAAGAIVLALWFMFDRRAPIKDISGSIQQTMVTAGDSITPVWDITFVRQCPLTVKRLFVSGGDANKWHIIEPTPGTEPFRLGRHTVIRSTLTPKTLEPGPTYYRPTFSFSCWPWGNLWPIEVEMPALFFTVVKA